MEILCNILLFIINWINNLFNNKKHNRFVFNTTLTAGQSAELDELKNLEGIILLNVPYYYTGAVGQDLISLLLNNTAIAFLPACELDKKHFYCPTVIFYKKQGDSIKISTENGILEIEQLILTYVVF